MSDRATWGVRLLLAGLILGLGLMLFVVTFDGSSFYMTYVASTTNEVTPLLGYILDGGILLAFAMMVAGITCVPANPAAAEAPVAARAPGSRGRVERASGRDARRRLRPNRPSSPHGST